MNGDHDRAERFGYAVGYQLCRKVLLPIAGCAALVVLALVSPQAAAAAGGFVVFLLVMRWIEKRAAQFERTAELVPKIDEQLAAHGEALKQIAARLEEGLRELREEQGKLGRQQVRNAILIEGLVAGVPSDRSSADNKHGTL